jgi:alanine-synthesizing transaminase
LFLEFRQSLLAGSAVFSGDGREDRRGKAIIADEVFLDFALEENRPASFAANRSVPTFTLSGLSKICGLPQMKAAWLIASGPQQWKRDALARLEVIADTYLSSSAPVQLAIPSFLEQRHAFQKQVVERVRRNLAELDRRLAAQKACSRLAFGRRLVRDAAGPRDAFRRGRGNRAPG